MNKLIINKNFGLLLCGKFVSETGDKFYALALSYWVLETTGSPSLMGLVLFSSMVPAIILGFFIGALIDRFDRKKLLVGADISKGLIVAAVVIAYNMDLQSLPLIITAQMMLSVCSAFFDPAVQSTIPQLVEREQLVKANSMGSLAGGVAMMIGPVLGGLSLAYIGYTFVFAVNSLSFIVSALFTMLIKFPPQRRDAALERSYKESVLEGYHYILGRKRLAVMIIIVALVHFFVGSIQVIIPVLATELAGNGAENLGYLQTFFGIGVIVTALFLSVKKHGDCEEKGVFVGIAGIGLIYIACGVFLRMGAEGLPPFLILFMLMSSAVIVVSTNYQTILQKNIDSDMAGRVFSVTNSLGDSSLPVAMLTIGILLDCFPWHLLIAAYGVLTVLISITLFLIYGNRKDN